MIGGATRPQAGSPPEPTLAGQPSVRRAAMATLLAGLVVGCASMASLTDDLSPVDRVFIIAAASWDADKDGRVTCDEWKAYAATLFDAADTNRDGRLTPAEFERLTVNDKTFITADFTYFDADRDGVVTRAELVERPNPAFKHLDRDNDCVLDAQELSRAIGLSRPATPSGGPPKGGKGGGGMPGGKGGMPGG